MTSVMKSVYEFNCLKILACRLSEIIPNNNNNNNNNHICAYIPIIYTGINVIHRHYTRFAYQYVPLFP